MKFLSFSQTKLGSSFDITRARVGGASVIPLLSIEFLVPPTVRRKVLGGPLFSGINSAKQAGKKEGGWGEGIFAHLLPFPFRLRKGKAEGGFGGNSATPSRGRFFFSAEFEAVPISLTRHPMHWMPKPYCHFGHRSKQCFLFQLSLFCSKWQQLFHFRL